MANRSTGIYGHFGRYASTAQLPNVAGADVQSSEVALGDLAVVGSTLYLCTTATLGAAVWAAVGGAGGVAVTTGEWAPAVTDPAAKATVAQILTGYYVKSGATVRCVAIISYEWLADGTPTVRLPVPTGLPIAAADAYTPAITVTPDGPVILPAYVNANTFGANFVTSLVTGNEGAFTVDYTYETSNP